VAVTAWNLATLQITAPTGYTGQFALTVAASAIETVTGDIANFAVTLPVTVVPANVTSPLVIDLNGDGVQTTALGASQGSFDLLNNGSPITSGWLSAQDGFLAIDDNRNGIIDDRGELFGGAIGDGYAKLASFDSNHDGVVDAKDARFSELGIWQDANGNHQTDAGELRSLADFGISGLNVNHTIAPEVQNGNWLLERGTVTFKDGHTAEMADAYFEIGQQKTEGSRPGSTRQHFDAAGTARPANGNSATIILRSGLEQPQTLGQPQILGIPFGAGSVQEKLGAAAAQLYAEQMNRPAPAIDWSNTAAASSDQADNLKKKQKSKQPAHWLTDFLGIAKPANPLDATGLSVTTPKTEEPGQPFVERRQRVAVDPDGSKLKNER
jgi:hypothetical protein